MKKKKKMAMKKKNGKEKRALTPYLGTNSTVLL